MSSINTVSIVAGATLGLIALFCDTAPVQIINVLLKVVSIGTFSVTAGNGVRIPPPLYGCLIADTSY